MSVSICSLASGSSGNATFVATERTAILVDCGPPAREVVARLATIGVAPERIDGILISHAHVDHYRSAGTLNARFGIPVYVDPSTARALARCGIRTSWKRVRETRPIPERIGDLDVVAMDTSHGFPPSDGRTVAYLLQHHRTQVAVVTDLGTVDEEMLRLLRGVDAILLEANYHEATMRRKLADPGYAGDWHYLNWVASDLGHLSNRQCAETLAAVVTDRTSHVFLGHVSENHPDPLRDNNDSRTARDVVRDLLVREKAPLPIIHRTYRIGRESSRPTARIEI